LLVGLVYEFFEICVQLVNALSEQFGILKFSSVYETPPCRLGVPHDAAAHCLIVIKYVIHRDLI